MICGMSSFSFYIELKNGFNSTCKFFKKAAKEYCTACKAPTADVAAVNF